MLENLLWEKIKMRIYYKARELSSLDINIYGIPDHRISELLKDKTFEASVYISRIPSEKELQKRIQIPMRDTADIRHFYLTHRHQIRFTKIEDDSNFLAKIGVKFVLYSTRLNAGVIKKLGLIPDEKAEKLEEKFEILSKLEGDKREKVFIGGAINSTVGNSIPVKC